MKVAVLCPGPSLLHRYPGPYNYAATWAVNRAMIVAPNADWLSAGDAPMFNGLLPAEARPRVGVVTMADVASEVSKRPEWSGLVFDSWQGLTLWRAHNDRRPLAWSVQIALLHAYDKGARHIDLYGADAAASGTETDCTGYSGADRSLERWAKEELDLAVTIGLLAQHDVTVRRVPP